MLQLILDFLGIDFTIVWTEELIVQVLPLVIGVAIVLSFYLFMCFMQFLRAIIQPKKGAGV